MTFELMVSDVSLKSYLIQQDLYFTNKTFILKGKVADISLSCGYLEIDRFLLYKHAASSISKYDPSLTHEQNGKD